MDFRPLPHLASLKAKEADLKFYLCACILVSGSRKSKMASKEREKENKFMF
jgi:hypothetical protein